MLGIRLVQGAVLPEWIDVNEPYIISSQLLAYDSKRIHQLMRMYHAEKKFLAATAARQGDWGWPPEAGKQMTVPHPIYSARTDD